MTKFFTEKRLVYLALGVLAIWFFSKVGPVLTPFALAAGLAYVLNPLVGILNHRLKFSRGLSVAVIYLLVLTGTIFGILFVGSRMVSEGEQFRREMRFILKTAGEQIQYLPEWSQETAVDLLVTVQNTVQFTPKRVIPFFSGALGRTFNVLVFFLAAFYFLKDGRKLIDNLKSLLHEKYHDEFDLLLERINNVLGNYLRGQLILVLIMSVLTYMALSILGVPYALILAVFTGFAEIIPFIGPVIAASIAVFVAATDTTIRFGLTPFTEMLLVIGIYTVLRQMEDLFIIPNVMGRLTKLHPLAVLFAVLAGGHLFGPIGLVLAVPVAATIKVVVEYLLEKVSQ